MTRSRPEAGRRLEAAGRERRAANLAIGPVPVATPTEQTPQNTTNRATVVGGQPEKAKPPGFAIGLLAGGGALALGGIGCLAGAWGTSQQASNADLTFANGTTLADRGRALNGAEHKR